MRVVSLLVLIACFCQDQARTLRKALPEGLAGGSGNFTNCDWLDLMPARPSRELNMKPEAVFEVVNGDERIFNASEFGDCALRSAGMAFGESGVELYAQAVRLTRTKRATLQIITSGKLERIAGHDGRYLLLSLLCGDRHFCIRFPSASVVGTSQHLSRKFLSIDSVQSPRDDTRHYAMIILVGVAGVIILVITGALCVCGGEEMKPPPAKLISLSQGSVDGATKDSFQESPSNHPTMTSNIVHEEDQDNTKREEIIKRQESQVNSRSDDGEQNTGTPVNDVKSDVNAQSTNPAEHVGPAEKTKEDGRSGREDGGTNEHPEVSEGRKSWSRSHSNRSDDGTNADEEHKDKKSKKSKRSFLRNKRPSLEKKDARGHTDNTQASLSVSDRPRAPTPTPQSEPHPRELPPPPSITNKSRNLPERQLSAPGGFEEDDQYEVVEPKNKRTASASEAEDSYETVNLRVRSDSAKDGPLSVDSTYDVIDEETSGRPASELYEVVDMEGRTNALVAEEEEEDTYEVVGGEEGVVSSADACGAKAHLSVNESDDPKYSKVRQRAIAKAESNEADGVDPKYSRVRHCVSVRGGENKDTGGEKLQEKDAHAAADSTDDASVSQDETYAEVQEDFSQEAKSERTAAAAERPRLLKHASTPELACGISADSENSAAPPTPSLDHLMEVAEASRPRAFTEGGHLQKRGPEDKSSDLEVAQVFEYPYARVDLTKKTRVSVTTEGDGKTGDDADASDDEPPPLPPIYVSLPKKEEEGDQENEEGSSEKKPVDQTSQVPSEVGLYDEVNPNLSTAVVIRVGAVVPPSARIVSSGSIDSDYETVEEMMKYTPGNAAASTDSSKGIETQSKQSEIASEYQTVQPVQVTGNAEVNHSPLANAQVALPEREPHYEPVEVHKDAGRPSSRHRAGSGKE